MDGTLVDSGLNFDLMRMELGFPEKTPILEQIETLRGQKEKEAAFDIVNKHEFEGAKRASMIDGVDEFLLLLKTLKCKTAVLTRNSKRVTTLTLSKFARTFDLVLTRDCIKNQKPHPEGLHTICRQLGVSEARACYIGDFSIDMEAAKNARMTGILYSPKKNKELEEMADFHFSHFKELIDLLK